MIFLGLVEVAILNVYSNGNRGISPSSKPLNLGKVASSGWNMIIAGGYTKVRLPVSISFFPKCSL